MSQKPQAPLEKLRPDEEIALFLSGVCALDWKKDNNSLHATNSVTNYDLHLIQEQSVSLSMFVFGGAQYNLYVRKDNSSSINIRTGDYNQECDKLLALLFQIATQKSHLQFLGV